MPLVVKLRGATLLLVVGIIMIIIGILGAAGGAMTMGSGSFYSSWYGLDAAAVQFLQISGAISLVVGLVMLVFGIIGIRFRNRADRVSLLIILGIILILIQVFSLLYSNVMASMSQYTTEQMLAATEAMTGISMADVESGVDGLLDNSIVLTVIGFVLPALFLLGALLNKLLAPKAPLQVPYAQPPGTPYAPQPQDGSYTQPPEEK